AEVRVAVAADRAGQLRVDREGDRPGSRSGPGEGDRDKVIVGRHVTQLELGRRVDEVLPIAGEEMLGQRPGRRARGWWWAAGRWARRRWARRRWAGWRWAGRRRGGGRWHRGRGAARAGQREVVGGVSALAIPAVDI